MLTPQDIAGKELVKAVFGGYDMSTVDDFLEQVAEDYAALYKENAVLKGKIKVLVEKVEEYRSTEDSMRMALLTAQKMGDDMLKEAKEKSETLLNQTKTMAETKRAEIDKNFRDEEERLDAAKKKTAAFVSAAKEICERYTEFLNQLDSVSAPQEAESESAHEENTAAASKKEEKIQNTVREIDNYVTKMMSDVPDAEKNGTAASSQASDAVSDAASEENKGEAAKPAAPAEDPDATKIFPRWDDDDEPTSPRPKFNIDDLKFGTNYNGEEDSGKSSR